MSEITNCPFCGGSAAFLTTFIDDDTQGWVACEECGAGPYGNMVNEDAVMAWNRRTVPACVTELGGVPVEELRTTIAALDVFLAAYEDRPDHWPVLLIEDDDALMWGDLRRILAFFPPARGGSDE
jgi:Lar family restriction alleviation protein